MITTEQRAHERAFAGAHERGGFLDIAIGHQGRNQAKCLGAMDYSCVAGVFTTQKRGGQESALVSVGLDQVSGFAASDQCCFLEQLVQLGPDVIALSKPGKRPRPDAFGTGIAHGGFLQTRNDCRLHLVHHVGGHE
ncbi:hypothetical protein [uncultured Sphingosinicella sp.]|uniref:hypothetical protein n=1 Tax=uncultured Sphingosinicella sp. TaxID=478748 RepID=UPI0030DA1051